MDRVRVLKTELLSIIYYPTFIVIAISKSSSAGCNKDKKKHRVDDDNEGGGDCWYDLWYFWLILALFTLGVILLVLVYCKQQAKQARRHGTGRVRTQMVLPPAYDVPGHAPPPYAITSNSEQRRQFNQAIPPVQEHMAPQDTCYSREERIESAPPPYSSPVPYLTDLESSPLPPSFNHSACRLNEGCLPSYQDDMHQRQHIDEIGTFERIVTRPTQVNVNNSQTNNSVDEEFSVGLENTHPRSEPSPHNISAICQSHSSHISALTHNNVIETTQCSTAIQHAFDVTQNSNLFQLGESRINGIAGNITHSQQYQTDQSLSSQHNGFPNQCTVTTTAQSCGFRSSCISNQSSFIERHEETNGPTISGIQSLSINSRALSEVFKTNESGRSIVTALSYNMSSSNHGLRNNILENRGRSITSSGERGTSLTSPNRHISNISMQSRVRTKSPD